jgi:hypothetical protein
MTLGGENCRGCRSRYEQAVFPEQTTYDKAAWMPHTGTADGCGANFSRCWDELLLMRADGWEIMW